MYHIAINMCLKPNLHTYRPRVAFICKNTLVSNDKLGKVHTSNSMIGDVSVIKLFKLCSSRSYSFWLTLTLPRLPPFAAFHNRENSRYFNKIYILALVLTKIIALNRRHYTICSYDSKIMTAGYYFIMQIIFYAQTFLNHNRIKSLRICTKKLHDSGTHRTNVDKNVCQCIILNALIS